MAVRFNMSFFKTLALLLITIQASSKTIGKEIVSTNSSESKFFIQKSNPCQPSPCGPNTICTVNIDCNPICRCVPGMIPKPDTITGCGPECVRDPDCSTGEVCLNQRCVDEPDPCNPSPCGPGAVCSAPKVGNRFSNPICR